MGGNSNNNGASGGGNNFFNSQGALTAKSFMDPLNLVSAPTNSPDLDSDYLTNPNDPRIQGFDDTAQRQALMHQYADAGRMARDQALAATAANMGGSRSTGTAGLLSDIAARQSYGQQSALADLSSKNYEQRLRLMDMLNNVKQAANALKTGQYNYSQNAKNSQDSSRNQSLAGLASLAAFL
jgi:hypothetical protein